MKGIRIKPEYGLNPVYKPADKIMADRRGEPYEIPVKIQYETGTIVERDVLQSCLIPDGAVIPYDDEAQEAFAEAIASPSLKKRMESLKTLAIPEVFDKLPRSEQARVHSYVNKWNGTKLQDLILNTQQKTQNDVEQRKSNVPEDGPELRSEGSELLPGATASESSE